MAEQQAEARPAPARKWLEQASHISQIIGAFAVVISLLYVGFQLQQNTEQLQREENNATQFQWQAIRLAIATDRDTARIWHAGLHGDRLDDVDQLRFDTLLSEHTWSTFHIWDRGQRGVFERGEFERGAAPPLARWICTPGGAPWWTRMKRGYPPGFVRDVDLAIARLDEAERTNCPRS